MAQQTAVEFVVDKILNGDWESTPWPKRREIIEQAKEMEKKQMLIELPSDEEIEKKANNWCTVELDEDGFVRLHDYYDLYELPAFIAGAKWMRDKILNK